MVDRRAERGADACGVVMFLCPDSYGTMAGARCRARAAARRGGFLWAEQRRGGGESVTPRLRPRLIDSTAVVFAPGAEFG